MRSSKLLTVFSWLLISAVFATAQPSLKSPGYFASLKKASAGGGGSGGALIHTETFEANEFDIFTEGGLSSGINGNYTVWKYQGSEACVMTNTTTFDYLYLMTSQRVTNCYSYVCILRLGNTGNKFTLSTFGSQDEGYLYPHGGGSWKVKHGAAVESTETHNWGYDTTNWVCGEFVINGVGSGIHNAWIRTNGVFNPSGAPDVSTALGTSTTQPNSFTFQSNNNESWEFDYLHVWDSRPTNWFP
jgi:hypothetical protein